MPPPDLAEADQAQQRSRIVDAQSSGKDPLLFYRSTFHDLGATSSTTVWNGSQDDPHSGWFDATTSFTPIHLQPAPQTI